MVKRVVGLVLRDDQDHVGVAAESPARRLGGRDEAIADRDPEICSRDGPDDGRRSLRSGEALTKDFSATDASKATAVRLTHAAELADEPVHAELQDRVVVRARVVEHSPGYRSVSQRTRPRMPARAHQLLSSAGPLTRKPPVMFQAPLFGVFLMFRLHRARSDLAFCVARRSNPRARVGAERILPGTSSGLAAISSLYSPSVLQRVLRVSAMLGGSSHATYGPLSWSIWSRPAWMVPKR